MKADRQSKFQALPSVEKVLEHPSVRDVARHFTHDWTVAVIRTVIERMRQRILAGDDIGPDPLERVVGEITGELGNPDSTGFCRVINATGIIIHTNLGRSPLADAAGTAMIETAKGYSNLEYDLATGKRGERFTHVRSLLCHLTGAEDAFICNNNAAAVMLCLNTLAEGREVVVSRGELVEIGGSFRMPRIMKKSGANMVEVGTTNRTHLGDYANAITADTGLILKVHTSNYRIEGFTSDVSLKELVALGDERGIPVMYDQGSGILVDFFPPGLKEREPLVRESVATGAHLVSFSGDKLLGGPQAGLVVGSKSLLSEIRSNPIARALRIDKLCLAAMESTLMLYTRSKGWHSEIPALQMIRTPESTLKRRAKRICDDLDREFAGRMPVKAVRCQSATGGGSLPTIQFPSWGISIAPPGGSSKRLMMRLRQQHPPVIGRIDSESLLFDVRTLMKGEEKELVGAILDVLRNEDLI